MVIHSLDDCSDRKNVCGLHIYTTVKMKTYNYIWGSVIEWIHRHTYLKGANIKNENLSPFNHILRP